MYLSKDTTNEHKSLRIQILLSTGTENEKINDAEKIGTRLVFLGTRLQTLQSPMLIFRETLWFMQTRVVLLR